MQIAPTLALDKQTKLTTPTNDNELTNRIKCQTSRSSLAPVVRNLSSRWLVVVLFVLLINDLRQVFVTQHNVAQLRFDSIQFNSIQPASERASVSVSKFEQSREQNSTLSANCRLIRRSLYLLAVSYVTFLVRLLCRRRCLV